MNRDYDALYKKYKFKYLKLKEQSKNMKGGGMQLDKPTMVLIKSETCPFCVNFKGDWDKLKSDYGDKYEFVEFDTLEDRDEVKKWNIQYVPTIFLLKDNKNIEFDGNANFDSVKEFINKA